MSNYKSCVENYLDLSCLIANSNNFENVLSIQALEYAGEFRTWPGAYNFFGLSHIMLIKALIDQICSQCTFLTIQMLTKHLIGQICALNSKLTNQKLESNLSINSKAL